MSCGLPRLEVIRNEIFVEENEHCQLVILLRNKAAESCAAAIVIYLHILSDHVSDTWIYASIRRGRRCGKVMFEYCTWLLLRG